MKRFLGLILPFGLAIVALGGYWAYWSRVASAIETGVRKAVPIATGIEVSGFPFRLTIIARDMKLAAPSGLSFSASRLEATASPFNPSLWVLVGALEPRLALPAGPERPLTATDLKASLRFNESRPTRFSMTFAAVKAGGDGGWQTGSGAFHLVADPKDETQIALSVDVNAIQVATLPDGPAAILGQKINHIRLAGPITKGPELLQSARTWARAGGVLQVMAGEVIWGPVAFTKASGSLGLSEAGLWNGTLKGEGALKPEGMKLDGLTADIELSVKEGQVSVLGLSGVRVPAAFR
jgi:hypothetical protein